MKNSVLPLSLLIISANIFCMHTKKEHVQILNWTCDALKTNNSKIKEIFDKENQYTILKTNNLKESSTVKEIEITLDKNKKLKCLEIKHFNGKAKEELKKEPLILHGALYEITFFQKDLEDKLLSPKLKTIIQKIRKGSFCYKLWEKQKNSILKDIIVYTPN